MRPVIDMDPAYQREGGVWGPNQQERLIDTLVNGLDVPKIYFERPRARRTGSAHLRIQYFVTDGKQRLETIRRFAENEISLPNDFVFFEDEDVQAASMSIEELRNAYPKLARAFMDYELPIVAIDTDSGDLVEEMFQRLNASSALNAAEKRNAIGGPARESSNTIADHPLLVNKSPIKSARYKYRELAAKFLVIEHQYGMVGKVQDTKARTLFDFFKATKPGSGVSNPISAEDVANYEAAATRVLDAMERVFLADDWLLRSIGTAVVYYIAFRDSAMVGAVSREKLEQFEFARRAAERLSEDDPTYRTAAQVRLRAYNAYVQSTNDGSALEYRAAALRDFITGYRAEDELAGLGATQGDEASLLDDDDD